PRQRQRLSGRILRGGTRDLARAIDGQARSGGYPTAVVGWTRPREATIRRRRRTRRILSACGLAGLCAALLVACGGTTHRKVTTSALASSGAPYGVRGIY